MIFASFHFDFSLSNYTNDVNDYKKALRMYHYTFNKEISFFPPEITDDMTDVIFYQCRGGFTYYTSKITLYYKTTNEELEKTLKKLSPLAKYEVLGRITSDEYRLPYLDSNSIPNNFYLSGFSYLIFDSKPIGNNGWDSGNETYGIAYSEKASAILFFLVYSSY